MISEHIFERQRTSEISIRFGRPRGMRLINRATREMILNTSCVGCHCHKINAAIPNLIEGCCVDCGCPQTRKAFEKFKEEFGTI